MIIQCDQCGARFKLDEQKVTETGVKIRCRKCQHIFLVKTKVSQEAQKQDSLLTEFEENKIPCERSPDLAPLSTLKASADMSSEEIPQYDETSSFFSDLNPGTIEAQREAILSQDSNIPFRNKTSSSNSMSTDTPPSDFSFSTGSDRAVMDTEPPGANLCTQYSPECQPFITDVEKGVPTLDQDTPEYESSWEDKFEIDIPIQMAMDKVQPADSGFATPFTSNTETDYNQSTDESPLSRLNFIVADSQRPEDLLSPVFNEEEIHTTGQGSLPGTLYGTSLEGTDLAPVPDSKTDHMIAFQNSLKNTDKISLAVKGDISDKKQSPPKDSTAPLPFEDVSSPPLSRRRDISIASIVKKIIITALIICTTGAGLLYLSEGHEAFKSLNIDTLSGLLSPRKAPVENIIIKNFEGSYQSNNEGKEFLLVRGEVINLNKSTRIGTQVRGIVYNSSGRVLLKKNSHCGNVFTLQQLTNLPMSKVDEFMNGVHGTTSILPGQSAPFIIVFSDLPKDAVEFGVEVAGSQPAKQ